MTVVKLHVERKELEALLVEMDLIGKVDGFDEDFNDGFKAANLIWTRRIREILGDDDEIEA